MARAELGKFETFRVIPGDPARVPREALATKDTAAGTGKDGGGGSSKDGDGAVLEWVRRIDTAQEAQQLRTGWVPPMQCSALALMYSRFNYTQAVKAVCGRGGSRPDLGACVCT